MCVAHPDQLRDWNAARSGLSIAASLLAGGPDGKFSAALDPSSGWQPPTREELEAKEALQMPPTHPGSQTR